MENSTLFDGFQNFFSTLYFSINNDLKLILDSIVFVDEKVIRVSAMKKIIGDMNTVGTIRIAYTFSYGFLIYFIYKFLISKITKEETEDIASFLYKLLVAVLLIGFSYRICEEILKLNALITKEIFDFGKKITGKDVSFKNVFTKIAKIISFSVNKDVSSLNKILQTFISYGMINLFFVYSLRYIYIKLLCIITPFAILFKTNMKTEYIFKAWIKSLIGLLFLQQMVAFIIIITLSLTSGVINIFSKVISVGCIYALLQVNELQRELFGSSSLYITTNLRDIKGGI